MDAINYNQTGANVPTQSVCFTSTAVIAAIVIFAFSILHYGLSISLLYDVRPSQCEVLKKDKDLNTQRHHLLWTSHVGLLLSGLLIVFLAFHYNGMQKGM
jgi:hypothetical protein